MSLFSASPFATTPFSGAGGAAPPPPPPAGETALEFAEVGDTAEAARFVGGLGVDGAAGGDFASVLVLYGPVAREGADGGDTLAVAASYAPQALETPTIEDIGVGFQTYNIDASDGAAITDDGASDFAWRLIIDTDPPPETDWKLIST